MMAKPEVGKLFLEKPLADNPHEARKLLDDLKAWGGRFRIGYLFNDTEWAQGEPPQSILWGFTADHFAKGLHNWKRQMPVSSFYGIHIIALLAERGYEGVAYSVENGRTWCALLVGRKLPQCMIAVNTLHPGDTFKVNGMEYETPFGTERRVEVLARSIRKFLDGQQPEYGKELPLWSEISFLNRA